MAHPSISPGPHTTQRTGHSKAREVDVLLLDPGSFSSLICAGGFERCARCCEEQHACYAPVHGAGPV